MAKKKTFINYPWDCPHDETETVLFTRKADGFVETERCTLCGLSVEVDVATPPKAPKV